MTDLKDKSSRSLQNIAIHLNWNLHPGAGENIVSSLLAASINRSEGFRNWLLDEVGFDGRHRDHLYAVPNKSIEGSIVRAIRETRHTARKQIFPIYPDVVIYDTRDEQLWKELGGAVKKSELSDALRKIRLVVIEVKHTSLKKLDKEKYDNLAKELARSSISGRGLLNRRRFVVLSSHTNAARDTIIEKQNRNKQEQRWYEYFNSECDGVTHLTLEDIYEEICEHAGAWCSKCLMLQLFQYYLALHLGVFDITHFHKEYWRQVIESSASAFDLKWSIADHINWLSGNALVKPAPDEENRWSEDKARTLKEIEFALDTRHRRTVRFKYNKKRSCEDLTVVINGERASLDMTTRQGCGKITRVMCKVASYLRTKQGR